MPEKIQANPEVEKGETPNQEIADYFNNGEKVFTVINGVVEVADDVDELVEKHKEDVENK